MKTLTFTALAVALVLFGAGPSMADDAFSYDTVRPGARFQFDSLSSGRDIAPAGSLSGPGHAGRSGPLTNTEGPGLRAQPDAGPGGYEDRITCGPGMRNYSIVDADRIARIEPMACGGGR
ncbi:MAG: hypothetical protein SGJ07_10035 [Rhodospirillaceae bacterium]|nr:hypothetical protein [Rhodospirillaceae bacterium]